MNQSILPWKDSCDLIAEEAGDVEAMDRHIGEIRRLVDQMGAIIESLLDFTRSGFAEPRLETVSVSGLLAEVEHDLHSEIRERGARITFDTDVDEPIVADPTLLKRVFSNLIGNSLKYARAEVPPRIAVHTVSDGERIVVSVSDNGIGIDARFAEKIFEPMQRLHASQATYEGVGMGLSLVKSIIEGHGGRVRLDTDFTEGTRIIVTLPHLSCRDEIRRAA